MTRTPLPDRASVVVIGGGVIGTSIAFHLAEAGVADVVLLERGELGCGSTCWAAGGVRAQFSDELNIALGARSLAAFTRFRERPGQEIDLRQVGYLFLLSAPDDVAAFERDVKLQNELGVASRMIDVAEARQLSPLIDTEGVLAAAYSPDDGHCTPESVVLGYATAARRQGAVLRTGTTVLDLERRGDRISAVATDQGTITADTVICAASQPRSYRAPSQVLFALYARQQNTSMAQVVKALELPAATAEEAGQVVSEAEAAFRAWRTTPLMSTGRTSPLRGIQAGKWAIAGFTPDT